MEGFIFHLSFAPFVATDILTLIYEALMQGVVTITHNETFCLISCDGYL